MSPEVVGALVGVAGSGTLVLIGYAIKGFLGKKGDESSGDGGGGNGKVPRHCLDHYTIVTDVAEVKTDVKWVRDDVKWIREHLEKKGHRGS
jgi:hypothetical protein